MVQVDHLGGELLGSAIEYLYAAGARNVQILPGVTKKNRPGQAIIIDASEARAEAIERVIAEELGSTGWHRLKTEHRHLPVESVSRPLRFKTGTGAADFELWGKRIRNQPQSVRPEHDSCRDLQQVLKEKAGLELPLGRIFNLAQRALQEAGPEPAWLALEHQEKGDEDDRR